MKRYFSFLHNMATSALYILKGTYVLLPLKDPGRELKPTNAEGIDKDMKTVIQTGLKL